MILSIEKTALVQLLFTRPIIMKVILAFLLAAAVSGAKYYPDFPPLSDEIEEFINIEAGTTWKAGKNFKDRGMTVAGLKRMCGVIKEPNNLKLPYREPHYIESLDDIPSEFDARKQWPSCKSIS